jgi:ABC-2 type transport system permease protein
VGKSILSVVLTITAVIISAKLTGYEPANIFIVAAALSASLLFYIALGTLLGLMAKTVVEASVVILPIIALFGMLGSYLNILIAKFPQFSFAKYLPNIQIELLADKVQNGADITEVWSQLGIICLWAAGACLLDAAAYKRQVSDDGGASSRKRGDRAC